MYDDAGIRDYRRVDGVGNLHDLTFDAAGRLYAVNTSGNAVVRIDDDAIATHWAGPPYFDGWHINCLTPVDGELYATAFTATAKASGWRSDPEPDGMLFRLSDNHVVCRGLAKPHDPRRLDGRWLVCASDTSELVAIADDGTVVRRQRFSDFTRGLAWNERFLFVGDSNPRGALETGATSTIHAIDRATWEPVARFALPVPEVYALVYEPAGCADPARYDLTTLLPRFSTEAAAASDEPWPTMDFVRPEEQRAVLSYAMPAAIACDSHVVFDLTMRNETPYAIASVGPAPVQIVAQWHDAAGIGDVSHVFDLTERLAAGAERTQAFFVPTPHAPGSYVLRLAVTQYDTSWTNVRIVTNNLVIAVRDDLPPTPVTTALATVASRMTTPEPDALASWSSAGVSLAFGDRRDPLDGVATRGLQRDGGVVARAVNESPWGDLLVMYDAAGIARAITRRALRASGREAIFDDVAAAAPIPLALPGALAGSLRVGFGTNGNRRREEPFLNRFRALGLRPEHGLFPLSRVLADASIRGSLTGEPALCIAAAGSTFVQVLSVRNDGDTFLVASGPNALLASFRWFAADGTQVTNDADVPRSALRATIGPAASAAFSIRIVAPSIPGRYRLAVSLLQEAGRWFCDVAPRFAWEATLTIGEAEAPERSL